MRFAAFGLAVVLFAAAAAGAALSGSVVLVVLAVLLALLVAVGIYDLIQRKHSILRNYPLLGHMRFALETIRPELQQYFIERNYDGRPFDRDTRASIYQRAKGIKDEQAYGTERDLLAVGSEWLLHSAHPVDPP